MKHVKLFEEFLSEEAMKVTPESDVIVDD